MRCHMIVNKLLVTYEQQITCTSFVVPIMQCLVTEFTNRSSNTSFKAVIFNVTRNQEVHPSAIGLDKHNF